MAENARANALETRFGCEIEICVRLSDLEQGCIVYPLSTGRPLAELEPFEKFKYYFIFMLSQISEELAEQIPEVGLHTASKRWIFDLAIPFTEDGTINVREVTSKEDAAKFDNYEIPFFYYDPTVVCGDNDTGELEEAWNENQEKPAVANESIALEFVTPVLRFIGPDVAANVDNLLRPYLLLLGLNKPHCFMVNYSTGFHVNVSLFDTDAQTLIPITEHLFLKHFIPLYLDFEREGYRTVRTRRPISKMGVGENYNATWARPLYKIEPEKLEHYLRLKMVALKAKDDEILEFRLFQSEKNMDLLLANTMLSITLLHRAYEPYAEAAALLRSMKQTKKNQDGGSVGLVFAPRREASLRSNRRSKRRSRSRREAKLRSRRSTRKK